MKTTLLFSAFLLTAAAFAQGTIPAFYDFNTFPGNTEGDIYVVTSPAIPLDETAFGENVVWTFNGLTPSAQSSTLVVTPSNADVAEYPGTTMLVETTTQVTGGENITRYFLANDMGGSTFLTGFEASGMALNYSTNNALLGVFPLSYGYTNTDDVAGTFDGMGVTGTFTGTGTSAVDAYGTLNVNIAAGENVEVIRLKTQQNLSLIFSGLPLGTITQTIYSYYNPVLQDGPIFRSITNTLNVPVMGINQTTYSVEAFTEMVLGINKPMLKNSIVIAPNPVSDVLHFSGNAAITGVVITDISGRVVLQSQSANDISVSHLSAGIYNVAIQSQSGTEVQKIVKR